MSSSYPSPYVTERVVSNDLHFLWGDTIMLMLFLVIFQDFQNIKLLIRRRRVLALSYLQQRPYWKFLRLSQGITAIHNKRLTPNYTIKYRVINL